MLPEDRLACIAQTDGTINGEAPALRVDDHVATLVQSVEDSDGSSSPPFAISLVPGGVELCGWSWLGSRERGFSRLWAASMIPIGTPAR